MSKVCSLWRCKRATCGEEVCRAVHYSGICRSRVRFAAADIADFYLHTIEWDRPCSNRPAPTARVVANVDSQDCIVQQALHPEGQLWELLGI
eukprot:4852070-Pleurochrysis_carterae.AAC.2